MPLELWERDSTPLIILTLAFTFLSLNSSEILSEISSSVNLCLLLKSITEYLAPFFHQIKVVLDETGYSHWPSQYSVCYYADIGEGCSPLKFGSYEIQPENGMVIVFDGMVVHEVPPTDFPRTCVAMNFAVSTGNRTT